MIHRFFVPAEWISGGQARLEGSVAHQIGRVLRMSLGDQVVLLDNSGMEYVMQLQRISRAAIEGEVIYTGDGQGEPHLRLLLYQAVLKGDKFEWVLQKGTELGVSSFVPVIALRSITRMQESWQNTHYLRWSRIITEAAEQSGRCVLPHLHPPLPFEEACQKAVGDELSIMPWEGEKHGSLRTVIEERMPHHLSIFIGPEGGWSEVEVAHARSCGIVPVSLGKRILRAETAAIATVAAVMYALSEMER